MDLSPFVQLITNLLSTDNNIRTQAEKSLSDAKKNIPDQLVIALSLIIENQSISVMCRSLSAVILRKQLTVLSTLSPNTIDTLKINILNSLKNTSDKDILRHICFLTSYFAGNILSDGESWDELLNFLASWAQSNNEHYRQASLEIFSQLLSQLDSDASSFFDNLQIILIRGLQDTSRKVRVAALNGTIHFLIYRVSSRKEFQNYLPQMFEIVTMSLSQNDDETARKALEYLIELAEFCPHFFINNYENLMEGIFSLSINTSIEDATRFSALEFYVSLCESKPSTARKYIPILTQFISLMLNMMTKIEDNPDWNEGPCADIDDEESEIGQSGLDRIALVIRGNILGPILFSMISNLIISEEWKYRRAALMAISTVGEGCTQYLTPNLDKVVQLIIPTFRDVHERVRWAACNTAGQLATDFGPLFQERYNKPILEAIVMVMDDEANPRVQSHAAAAIINFCDHCNSKIIEPFLPGLLKQLDKLLNQGKLIVLEQTITAVAAVAECVKDKFTPYYDNFMPFFKNILINATSESHSKIRAKSMEAISLVASGVGLEVFAKDGKEVLDTLLLIQSGDVDDIQLPFLQQAWARLCKVLGKEFVPYLPALIPPLLRSAALPAELKVVQESDSHTLDEDVWCRLTYDDDRFLAINSVKLQEKTAALTMLFWLTDRLGEYFFPYVDKLIPICEESIQFYHNEQVRTAAATLLPCIVRSTTTYLNKNQSTVDITSQVTKLYQHIILHLLTSIEEEPILEVVVILLNTLISCIIIIGKSYFTDTEFSKLKQTLECLLNKFLKKREVYQQVYRENNEIESDSIAININCDVFVKIGEVISKSIEIFNGDILNYITDLCSVYKTFLGDNAVVREKYIALHLFNNLIEYGGDNGISIYKSCIPNIVQNITSEHPGICKISANGIILLSEYSQQVFPQIAADVINRLNSVITKKESRGKYIVSATQTCIIAIGKIIEFYPSLIDLNQVLHVWFEYLPANEPPEANIIYHQLCNFFMKHTNILLGNNFSNLPRILQLFVNIIGELFISNHLTQTIISIIKKMQTDFPNEVMQQAWITLSTEQQKKLQQYL